MTLTTRATEKAALGRALRRGESVRIEEFRFPPHPDIAKAILAVRAAGLPVGLGTVGEWLKEQGLLEQVGGTIYLAEVMLSTE